MYLAMIKPILCFVCGLDIYYRKHLNNELLFKFKKIISLNNVDYLYINWIINK